MMKPDTRQSEIRGSIGGIMAYTSSNINPLGEHGLTIVVEIDL